MVYMAKTMGGCNKDVICMYIHICTCIYIIRAHTYMYMYKYYTLDAHDCSAFEAAEAGDRV
jgi:hypothetical protein